MLAHHTPLPVSHAIHTQRVSHRQGHRCASTRSQLPRFMTPSAAGPCRLSRRTFQSLYWRIGLYMKYLTWRGMTLCIYMCHMPIAILNGALEFINMAYLTWRGTCIYIATPPCKTHTLCTHDVPYRGGDCAAGRSSSTA